MEFIIDSLGIVGAVFVMLFPLWPLVVLAPLLRRTEKTLTAMVLLWIFMLGGWVLARRASPEAGSFLIPEPLNTGLFFLTGAVLIIVFIALPLLRRSGLRRLLNAAGSPRDLLDASPAQFEEMVVEYYQLRGAKAWRTGAAGDHGIDVLVETPKGEKWVVQCKRWRGSVGEPEVRDFYGVQQHQKAVRGVLITTGTFSGAARAWARGKPLVLADGRAFLKAWEEAKKG